jgi:hypothetical protein
MDYLFGYGPQYRHDPPFTARMRFHQSWYRSQILKLPYGTGPKITSKTYYGNMLTLEDGEKGLNFLRPHIFEVAKRRVAESKGMIDRFRLFCNMLSSQPMCFNLFGPLVDDVEHATDLFQLLLPGEIKQVDKIRLEYTPEPANEYLNDRTAFDAYIEYTRIDGGKAFIGIQTKLTENFSEKIYNQPSYWKWTKSSSSSWPESSWAHLIQEDVNQIWRNHLLAAACLNHPESNFSEGHFWVIYHPLDTNAGLKLNTYQALLKPEDKTFSQIPLDRLVDTWLNAAAAKEASREWLSNFSHRYSDLSRSNKEFEKYHSHSH